MKKPFTAFALILFISMASGQRLRRPIVELEPRLSIYVNYLTDDTELGIGADIMFNPSPNLGFRIGLTDIYLFQTTIFSLNHGLFTYFPKIDALFYISTRRTQPYIHLGLGYTGTENYSWLVIGGGFGLDYFMSRTVCFSFEPGLYIFTNSYGGSGNTETAFRINLGLKYGIMK